MTVTNDAAIHAAMGATLNAGSGSPWTAFELMPSTASGDGSKFWHGVQLYENDAALAAVVCRFLSDGLDSGEGLVVVATEAHHQVFAKTLQAQGVDLSAAHAKGQY